MVVNTMLNIQTVLKDLWRREMLILTGRLTGDNRTCLTREVGSRPLAHSLQWLSPQGLRSSPIHSALTGKRQWAFLKGLLNVVFHFILKIHSNFEFHVTNWIPWYQHLFCYNNFNIMGLNYGRWVKSSYLWLVRPWQTTSIWRITSPEIQLLRVYNWKFSLHLSHLFSSPGERKYSALKTPKLVISCVNR